MTKRRVVVTGVGIVSPVGSTIKQAWENIVNGVSGIKEITAFDASEFSVKISGSVSDFDVNKYIDPKDQKKMDTFVHYGIGASAEAIEDSGIEVTDANAHRIGVAIGSGIGGLPYIEKSYEAYLKGGPRKISPFFVPSSIINMVAGNLSIKYGLKGPNISIVSACSTGTHNIGDAARMIERGTVDIMVAGGSEMCTCPLGIGGFASAKALCATHNDSPELASRPFDKERNGFVLGDGAGILVLEEYEHAKKRNAKIYCEVAGFGMNSDAYHMTAPSEGGHGAAKCMSDAIADAGLNVSDVQYINAHGTSTPAGDKAETDAIKLTFAENAYNLAVSSIKSMIGHLLGAAGGVEAVFSALSIRDQIIPPTINLTTPDPACDLDYVPNEARKAELTAVISNSFGFGGTNSTILLKKI